MQAIVANDSRTAAAFLTQCVQELGNAFHPDEPFANYLSETGDRLYPDEVATTLDANLARTFEFLDPYVVAFKLVADWRAAN